MRSTHVAKKLDFYEILSIESVRKKPKINTSLQHVKQFPEARRTAMDCWAIETNGTLLLPRRKRGEKFRVRYTAVKEILL